MFHAPLNRAACEALGRATAARLGRRFGRDLALQAADLGWSIRLPEGAGLVRDTWRSLLELEGLEDDVLEGLDRGDLPAQRFRYIAATGLMVLRNPEHGRRVRVGGMNWVSSRLYPLVKAACPQHPLLRETRREVLHDLLDLPAAVRWLRSHPGLRLRKLSSVSPFAAAWITPAADEPLQFESPADALRRLHERLTTTRTGRSHETASPSRRSRKWQSRRPCRRGVELTPEGGAICHGERTAVIADVHLGYEWARGSAGDCVPAHSLAETVAKLDCLLARSPIERLVVAGDLVESHRPCRRTFADLARLVALAWRAGRRPSSARGQSRSRPRFVGGNRASPWAGTAASSLRAGW